MTPESHTLSYDANGNILNETFAGPLPQNPISLGSPQGSFTYDDYDELPRSISTGNGTRNYRYDVNGQRIVKEVDANDKNYYLDGVIINQNNEVLSYQTPEGYVSVSNNGGIVADYFYTVPDWLGTNRAIMDATGNVMNAHDHYPFGKRMPARHMVTDAEGNRYQYTGHEFDEETGYGYHGARYYNRELGRYMNVDRFAEKFFDQSPYVYAGNQVVNAVDVNGDSVLFYSSEGEYLGYAHNTGKNLITVIDKGDVEVFKVFYKNNRESTYVPSILSKQEDFDEASYFEDQVAALSLMGTRYDVDAFQKFHEDNWQRTFDEDGNPTTTDGKDNRDIEWGTFLYVMDGAIAPSTDEPISGGAFSIPYGPTPEGAVGDIHLHTLRANSRPSSDSDFPRALTWNNTHGTGPSIFNIMVDHGWVVFYRSSPEDQNRYWQISRKDMFNNPLNRE